jgi:hypothetical protein
MPYKVEKNGDGYKVVNAHTGVVRAKHTTKEKADAQVKLLHAIEHGYRPH